MTPFVRVSDQEPYNTLANRSQDGVSFENNRSLYCEHMFVDCQVLIAQKGVKMREKIYQADWLDQISTNLDFRKSRSSNITDRIISRSQLLPASERDYIHAMYIEGKTAAQIARLGNMSARQVIRVIKNAITRLDDPLFIFVMSNNQSWSSTRRKVALSLFQSGRSIRATAEHHSIKVHLVRHHRAAILEQYHAQAPSSHTRLTHAPNRNWKHTTNTHASMR
jgi:DNA-binding CsgD family transcriptional regulator